MTGLGKLSLTGLITMEDLYTVLQGIFKDLEIVLYLSPYRCHNTK